MNYGDFIKGIEKLSVPQMEVLYSRLQEELKKRQSKTVVTSAEITEQTRKIVKIVSREITDKPKSVIECCLHCGSVSIKKHGTTKGGVQRYICKDCGKTFSENYGLITHYTHLADWQWKEAVRATVEGISLTELAKNIGTSTSTAWTCRVKIYQTIKNIYGYGDTFNNIVEVDGKYERVSFKGCKDKLWFIDKLGRLPRHHMSRAEKHGYLDSCGKYEELFKTKPKLLKEMIFSSQKRLMGRDTVDTNHQHVCIITAIDRSNNIYVEPITSGSPKSSDIYTKLQSRLSNDAVLVTDDHHSYKYYCRKEKIEHVIMNSKLHSAGAYSLARVNSLHSAIDRFLGGKEYLPATKYLDIYLMMFWWLQKNKDCSTTEQTDKLYKIMTGYVDNDARAHMKRITTESLVSRPLPIDTKGYF
jgi:transposase-like protein